jgi:hypothetical protein
MSPETKKASQNARGDSTKRKYQRKKVKFLSQPWMVGVFSISFSIERFEFSLAVRCLLGGPGLLQDA